MKAILEQDVIVGCRGGFTYHSKTHSTWARRILDALDLAEAGLDLPINKYS